MRAFASRAAVSAIGSGCRVARPHRVDRAGVIGHGRRRSARRGRGVAAPCRPSRATTPAEDHRHDDERQRPRLPRHSRRACERGGSRLSSSRRSCRSQARKASSHFVADAAGVAASGKPLVRPNARTAPAEVTTSLAHRSAPPSSAGARANVLASRHPVEARADDITVVRGRRPQGKTPRRLAQTAADGVELGLAHVEH
jgi:hypothetical protein